MSVLDEVEKLKEQLGTHEEKPKEEQYEDTKVDAINEAEHAQTVEPEFIQEPELTKDNEPLVMTPIQSKPEMVLKVQDNAFIKEIMNVNAAANIAKNEYAKLENQEKIATKIGKVAQDNTEAEIEGAAVKVEEKKMYNSVKKQEITNKLLQLSNEKTLLQREQKHALEMQRVRHIKDKYSDLLLRTCRKRQKDANNKWRYMVDKEGNPVINVPGKVRLATLRFFDGIVTALNQVADILSALNKGVLKGGLIILILALLLVPGFRTWLLGLIGITL